MKSVQRFKGIIYDYARVVYDFGECAASKKAFEIVDYDPFPRGLCASAKEILKNPISTFEEVELIVGG